MRTLKLGIAASMLCMAAPSFGAVLYSDDFETNTIANYTINTAPSGATVASQQGALAAFDYSAFGIPAAPGQSTTLGLRLRANVPGSDAAPVTTRPTQTTSGLSVSPTGQNFGSTYQVTMQVWSNFNGSANASGLADNGNSQGGTNNVLMAVGTSGTVPMVVGNPDGITGATIDGIAFATTGDGGITEDYRAFKASSTSLAANSGAYHAGSGTTSRQNTNIYYTGIPSLAPHSAPAVQPGLSTAEFNDGANNTQSGQTQIGSFGFAWHTVVMAKTPTYAAWYIDGTQISMFDTTGTTLGGNDFAMGMSDVNTSPTRHPSLLFTVFDGVVVSDTITIPEPGSIAAVAGIAGVALRRRRK